MPRPPRVAALFAGWWQAPIAIGLICAAAPDLQAGSGEYLVDVWTGERGLPNSSVTAIAQTPDGYLWAGTYNGLARFDGVRFLSFDPANTPALARARIGRLYVDGAGTLWINTHDGSLTSWRAGRFMLEWQGDGLPDATVAMVAADGPRPVFLLHTGDLIRQREGQSGTNAWEVLHPPGASSGELAVGDREGAIWCRGRDQQLWRLVGARFEPVSTNNGLAGRQINCLTADGEGRVWVGTDRELAAWTGSHFEVMTPTNGEISLAVNYLHVGKEGEVYALANGRVRKARGRQWLFEAEACRGVFTNALDRLGMEEDRAGGAWIYHYGKGIFHVRPDGRTRQLAAEESFPGERVDCFYQDREGNLWAGVDRGGLVRMREKAFAVLGEDASTARAAVSVAEDAQGAVWVGTFGGGLRRWLDGEWQTISLPGGTRRGFVFSIYPEGDRVWVSVGEEDLWLGTRDKFEPVSPAVHGVKALLASRSGLWVGTKSGLVLLADGQVRRFQPQDGIARRDMRALAEGPDGAVWAGSGNGVLYRIETNRVESFQPKDALGSQPIWSLLADSEGTVWVGTFRGGLLRFREGRFTRYTRGQGLPDDVICQMLEDGSGRLWVGTQQGIFRASKEELNAFARGKAKTINCTSYGRYDGLPSLECSGSYQPAAWRASDGRLLFSTLKGVVAVNPEELAPNRLPPPVLIEEVLVDGQDQARALGSGAPSSSGARGKSPGSESVGLRIEVPAGKRQVEVRYTALSFVSPDRVRFRHRLDGLDEDWMEAGTSRAATYNFLPPGHYRFHVTACNNDGVWNTTGAALAVTVLPHIYETWWFLALAAVAATAAVAGTARYFVVRRMRRQLEHLEGQRAVERDRARIAKDIHDDLGAGLTHITLLSELARRSPVDAVPAQLNHISDMARELTRAMDETVWAVNPRNDSLEGLMTYVTKFAQDYLNVAGIRCRLDLPAQLPPHALSAEVRHNLYLAVKETLNNVVKHARASEVWLRLELFPAGFVFVIEDNGRGLVGGDRDSNSAQTGRIASGQGLGNIENRLAASGGRCRVTSEPGRGTRVEFTVKLSTASLARNGDSPKPN